MSDDGHDEQCEGDRGRRICGCAARSHLTPAAAVPEAEDGREAIYQTAYAAWRAATNATRTTFAEADALRKVVDAVLSAVPARDDERERLAAMWAAEARGRADLLDCLQPLAEGGPGMSDEVIAEHRGYNIALVDAASLSIELNEAHRTTLAAAPLPEGQEGT